MRHTNRPASLFRIWASVFYDGLVLFGLLMGATALLIPFRHGAIIPAGTLSFQVYLLTVMYLYFDICWRKSGQTVGMRVWKIRLVPQDQGKLTHRQTLIRFLSASLSLATLGVGYWYRWHDRLSRTVIVRVI